MHKGNIFGYYILDLKEFADIDKKAAIKETKDYLRKIEKERGLNNKKTKTILIALFILTVLIGIVASVIAQASFVLYFFGLAFFAAGYIVGISDQAPVLGTIFIFSHGGMGFWLMSTSIVNELLNKEIYIDRLNMQHYMNTCLILLIIGTFILVLCNIFSKIRDYNIFRIIPLCIFNIILVMIIIFKLLYLGV